jgi:putative flippase GtrA
LSRPSGVTSFTRSQFASLAATGVDFGTLVACVEWLRVWYVAATAIGACLGAVTNFLLGRHWTFEARHGQVHHQAWKYALVSGGSLLLNSAGVYAFTDGLGLKYMVSKLITAFLVGVLYNFPLHRGFVFR